MSPQNRTGKIVTVDGPGGTGKSTVSRVIAYKAGLPHLDTGAYYRAATLAVVEAGVDPTDERAVVDVVSGSRFDQESGHMFLDGRDVSEEIRSEEVTSAVSAVSAHPGVRRELVEKQRSWIDEHDGRGVIEGRDIGSVVFPDADLKIYLDASPEVRARRRARETGEDFDSVLADLNRRDRLDSTRVVSPLKVPEGAVVVDTSELSFEQVVEHLLHMITAKS
ncbi:MAG TPA: (d)CMP kinase [Acidimicrobiia bacterium]